MPTFKDPISGTSFVSQNKFDTCMVVVDKEYVLCAQSRRKVTELISFHPNIEQAKDFIEHAKLYKLDSALRIVEQPAKSHVITMRG